MEFGSDLGLQTALAVGLHVALAGALVPALLALAASERRRRAALAGVGVVRKASDALRDDVWRLEAAAAARDRAEAASEAKSRFLATVSHEIRTPLAGIVGTADLLAAMPLDAEAASYVAAMRTSGAALGSLIDEILDFSRIEAGRLDLDDIDFAVRPLVEGVVELLSPRAHGKGLAIAGFVQPGVPETLRSDPARIRQILLNLAGNAIKFTHTGGVGIDVGMEADGTVRFAVCDTGCGISPERRHAVFEEFEQGDLSPARAQGGAGLGLAISRALAHRLGGALTLAHSDAGGSTFALALSGSGASAAPPPPPPMPTHVLLAANGPFEASFLTRRLQANGARVTLVETMALALDALGGPDAAFDLVIVDCALADAAASLTDAARNAGAARVVVLLSAFERRALAPTAWRAFDGWLVKPVREASLRACLDQRGGASVGPLATAPLARLDGCRALVAEDDDVNALIATRLLQRQGASVVRVHDGIAALDALDDGAFDVVLMDIRMPRLDGLAAARLVRERDAAGGQPAVPLIAISANAFAEDRRAALAAGFDRFFVKPAPLDALAATIAELTRTRRAAA